MNKRAVNPYQDHFLDLTFKVRSEAAREALKALIAELNKEFDLAHTDKQNKALSLFILNAIYHNYGTHIIFLSSGRYTAKATEHNPSGIGSTAIIGIYRQLIEHGLFKAINPVTPSSITRKSTVIQATGTFKKICKQYQEAILQEMLLASDYVELRQKLDERGKRKSIKLDYLPDDLSKAAGAFAKDYSIWLRSADIDCVPTRREFEVWETSVDKRYWSARHAVNVDLVRIYNVPARVEYKKASIPKAGGRFYRGFWIDLPSIVRKEIKINGESTVEIDFRAMNPLIMYFLKTSKPWEFYPYEHVLVPTEKARNPKQTFPKPLVKCCFTWCINVATKEEAIKTLNRKLPASRGLNEAEKSYLKRYDLKVDDLLGACLNSNPAIAPYFFMNPPFGATLQFIDSEIMQSIMLKCMELGIVCLPVHDGAIVPKQYEAIVKEIMVGALTAYFSVEYKDEYLTRLVSLEYEPDVGDEGLED